MNVVSTINGQKTIDFKLLEEFYGVGLSKEIQSDYEYCIEQGIDWKFEEIGHTDFFKTFAFSTYAFCDIYEVFLERKTVSSKNYIGFSAAEKVVALMASLNEAQ